MSIKRFYAIKDNTITNAFQPGLTSRAINSNMGSSDILEAFSIYGQASSDSLEKSRILLKFSTDEISTLRQSGTLPDAGSVKFKLKLFNATHSETLPKDFTLTTHVVTTDWSEGSGLDMESYSDLGSSNWVSASTVAAWTTPGGDFMEQDYRKEFSLTTGVEDVDVDITDIVEDWLNNTNSNHGLMVKLTGSFEDGSLKRSYYTKRFFARGSQYFFKRPIIEAQWDSSEQADLPDGYVQQDNYVYAINNLKTEYKNYETAKISVYTRLKNWQPNIYTKASQKSPVDIVDDSYYKVTRISDGLVVIPYSYDDSTPYTKMSYNSSGSYFDLDMSIFEPGYMYELCFTRKKEGKIIEQEERFRFRVSK